MFQKKKIEEPIFELSEKEIKKIKDKLAENPESHLNIKDISIDELYPQSFSNVIITVNDNKHVLFMPENMNVDKYKTFRKSRGGRFSQDVLNHVRKQPTGKYILVDSKDERKILRLIEDDEILMYQTLKLLDGIIKDKPYMLLRTIGLNEKLTNVERYIKETTTDFYEETEVIQANNALPEMDDDHESLPYSISLFDE